MTMKGEFGDLIGENKVCFLLAHERSNPELPMTVCGWSICVLSGWLEPAPGDPGVMLLLAAAAAVLL
jgi:hypothetical protein